MTAYYNEHDPFAAAWLRELIKAGLIAPGIVDERSIEDVRPEELAEYTQCHFFAGIGGWSYALRLAGWPDDRPVWTGSCPCQPFSAAGKGDGFADERHLWPAWDWLIGECKPGVIFGEQVESAINHGWLDLVQTDLEAKGYAVGAVGLPAAGLGAPHIRQRLWFVADLLQERCRWRAAHPEQETRANAGIESRSNIGELAESMRAASERRTGSVLGAQTEVCSQDGAQHGDIADGFEHGSENSSGELADRARLAQQRGKRGTPPETESADTGQTAIGAGASTRGFWHPADWLPCRDGKARPVEPGTFPLAHGVPARVGRLRGYGNAIVPQVAAEVIRAHP